jgi:NADP-dependent 3-hydroxy acid dehydrogenase YdfG
MPTIDISGATALVTGASRGFGRAIATSLTQAGAQVIGVARDKDQLKLVTRSSRSPPTRPLR